MGFQTDPHVIRWRVHLKSPPPAVYEMLATDGGRSRFWAETTEAGGEVRFRFPNGLEWRGRIIENLPPRRFAVQYLGNSSTTFELSDDGQGGTDLLLEDAEVPPEDRTEVIAGWISVLMALKAAVDYGVDLRNHDPQRTWDQGYVEN